MSILVTRPSPNGEQLVELLKTQGLTAYHAPLINIIPGSELPNLPTKLDQLESTDLVFLLSKNAVWYANSRLQQAGLNWPNKLSYYGIGGSTGKMFQQITGRTIVWPEDGETSEILLALPELQFLEGKKVLLLRGNGGRELLASTLRSRGAYIDYCECYSRQAINYEISLFNAQWRTKNISTIVVTSGQQLNLLTHLIADDYQDWWYSRHLLVVSHRIANIAHEMGWKNIDVANSADNNALLNALISTDMGC
ncbi:uroporphyrinogen-III synthase [Moellerella wisconsensis]|uniref:Uroporphyrinogen-III synthase n=1 Tax=Moellerella wisconsensis ATCC 35017 TaxID=1354267 RepID=A0A0N1KJR4_9GAMM|nr:uroporphyrinogen-III synthase [Moellerella wisconsensis]KPD04304.1 uroporphyrinogen-III synthase [Moellerella wisconsensis ATCC 35017]VFS52071.1 uroporphyrinogen-III synthase [Moellerella wisconsensis]